MQALLSLFLFSSSWKQPPASLASISSLPDPAPHISPGSPLLTHSTVSLYPLMLLECPLWQPAGCHHQHPPPPLNQEALLDVIPEKNSHDYTFFNLVPN